MGIFTTKPVRAVELQEFRSLKKDKQIMVSQHALNHLSEKQRKVFKEQELINMLDKETPRKVYLQENGRYSGYYRKSDGYRRLILDVSEKKL